MRILLAHNNYGIQGGAEVFFHEIGRLLEAAGHTVVRYCCAEDGLSGPETKYYPRVEHYASGGFFAKALRVPSVIYNLKARAGIASLIEDFRPDLVHAFAIYGRLTPSILDAASAAGVPVALSCNDYKHICPNYKLYHHGKLCEDCKGGRFSMALRNNCCHGSLSLSAVSMIEAKVHDKLDLWRKNVDVFLFASRFMAEKTEEFWGKGRIKLDLLRNPFDAEAHHVQVQAGDYLLYFGRLIDEKGVDLLVDAAGAVPEIPVVVIGDGPDRQKLEQRASTLSNVRFVGPVWGAELKPWLAGARSVVVPSRWHENFPYVILQAFAAGKTVIGSKRGGIPELVDAGPHGWLFDPEDQSSLLATMRHAMSLSNDELIRMGKAAQEYVTQEFSDRAVTADLMRIYEGILE